MIAARRPPFCGSRLLGVISVERMCQENAGTENPDDD
jgi:hypothetical protein